MRTAPADRSPRSFFCSIDMLFCSRKPILIMPAVELSSVRLHARPWYSGMKRGGAVWSEQATRAFLELTLPAVPFNSAVEHLTSTLHLSTKPRSNAGALPEDATVPAHCTYNKVMGLGLNFVNQLRCTLQNSTGDERYITGGQVITGDAWNQACLGPRAHAWCCAART